MATAIFFLKENAIRNFFIILYKNFPFLVFLLYVVLMHWLQHCIVITLNPFADIHRCKVRFNDNDKINTWYPKRLVLYRFLHGMPLSPQ
ncbi:hypothetical protein BST96_11245 [Oceanicoccus sagamiensis]|uniref:Uncharacterized protein n=1 Tax=Oceanicoccus sagamiensis TaxID=716816 RepID=A0A1X9NIC8_9GAMM|nr:hypothetical protein BST96_11245 [Oceanicoccus sagamiensis]